MKKLLGNIVSSTIIISTVTCAVHESLSRAGVVGPWTIVDRDANSRTWAATITEESPSGGTTYRTNYVQELATGMHFKGPSGEWQESQETFSILPDGSGAVAQNGPYQVFAPSDIYEGTINITLPSGEVLKTRPVGISYFDGTNNILIAELTNSIGQLSADGKTVTWASAFSDFAADIVATYHKGYFECDLIFREQPPTPGSLGLTDNCRLQLLTETFDSPTPEVESENQSPADGAAPGTDPSGLTNSAPVVDGIPYASTLKFGGMRMPAGQAFFIGSHGNSGKSFNVHKSWLHTQGRQFLIEDLKYNVVQPDLSQLQSSTVQPSKDKLLAKGGLNHRRLGLPGFRPARKSTRKMELARADIESKPGFVWDYVLQGSTNGFTLKADTEYVVTGPFYVSGVLVIEGGSLIRYTNSSSAKISFSGPLACRTDFYRPAIFTCQDDKSVGAFWGTGSVGPIAATYLEDTSTADNAYRHLRFCYANKAISITTGYQGNELWHCQFVQCTNAVVSTAYRTLGLYNVLASGCGTVVSSCSSFIAQHVTSDKCGTLGSSISYPSSSTLTNCILTGLTNLNASFVQANCRQASSGVGIYQSAGAGYYYLASGSGCQDAGSTNLHPRLVRDLQRLTTWPPVMVSSGSLPGDQTFSPQVQLDTDIPDQGFHYYSLDYALGAVYTTNAANISITPGTALAAYTISNSATPWGLNIGAGANLSSKGTATAPVWITSYNMVQEQPMSSWAKPSSGLVSDSYSGGAGVLNGGLRVVNDAFDYDNASRLRNVVDNSTSTPYSAAYINIVNSDLIGQITFKTNGVLRMTTIKQFDFLNRLTSISSIGTAANSTPVSFSYVYNNANQRTLNRSGDGSYWRFGYDSLGQVISGHKYFGDQTPVAGQQFDYAFDTIGNRTQTKTGGDSLGANQRQANYSDNLLNQYISRDVPGAIDVMGIGIATNPVTVNGLTAYRKGEYFRQQVNVANTSTSAWTQVTVSETGQSPQSGYQYLPKTREQFSYDDDGNLTSDGRWNYGWDAENRLTAMTNNTSLGPQQVIRFEYDAKSRRIHKQVWGNNVGSGSATNDVKFVYDGWNLLGVFNSPSTLLQSFLWGLDLSGSIQGAGGVGGLLEVAYYGTQTTNCFVAFDGNGNVSALVNAADGGSVAQYEYGPFGEVLRATGPMAKANPFRFSTKYQDDETDLVYYGGRYLKTTTGGWLSRDPIDEPGFMMLVGNEVIQQPSPAPNGNPYGFVGNDPITYFDVLGFWRSYEHRSLTKIAWDNARLPSELVGITSIYKTIEDANIAVDSGASANDLRRHYNRGLSEDIANAKQRYSEWLRIQQTSFDNLLEHPSRTTCDFALKVLGQLSHSWEDHYAHAIGINSPFRGNPGPIKGDPDHLSPDLKPSSWGGLRNWGEHGFSEPAWREADGGADRAKKAADFVTDKFRAQMPKWWNACHCYYGYN